MADIFADRAQLDQLPCPVRACAGAHLEGAVYAYQWRLHVPVRHTTPMPLSRLKLNQLHQIISYAGVPAVDVDISHGSGTELQTLICKNKDEVAGWKTYGDESVEHFKYAIQHPRSSSILVINNYTLLPETIAHIRDSNLDVKPPILYALEAYVPESERYRWAMATNSWNPDVEECANQWAESIAEVITTPNPWEDTRAAQAYAGYTIGQTDNSPFSAENQAIIAARLRQLMNSIVEQGQLTSEQITELKMKLDEIKEASTRLGRKDWLLLFYGGIFSLILGAVVPADIAQHMLVMVMHGIGHLFTGEPGPLPISGR